TTTAPYFGLLGGITTVLVLTAQAPGPEGDVYLGLWRFAMVTFGAAIGTAAQLFLWPEDPEDQLRGEPGARLAGVGGLRGGVGGGTRGSRARWATSRCDAGRRARADGSVPPGRSAHRCRGSIPVVATASRRADRIDRRDRAAAHGRLRACSRRERARHGAVRNGPGAPGCHCRRLRSLSARTGHHATRPAPP